MKNCFISAGDASVSVNIIIIIINASKSFGLFYWIAIAKS